MIELIQILFILLCVGGVIIAYWTEIKFGWNIALAVLVGYSALVMLSTHILYTIFFTD